MTRCWLLVGHNKNVSGVQFVFAHVCPGSCPLWGGATTVVATNIRNPPTTQVNSMSTHGCHYSGPAATYGPHRLTGPKSLSFSGLPPLDTPYPTSRSRDPADSSDRSDDSFDSLGMTKATRAGRTPDTEGLKIARKLTTTACKYTFKYKYLNVNFLRNSEMR